MPLQILETQAKPFLKWAGGKGQLIDQIKECLPKEFSITGKIEKYIEPFVGGGALFFWLSQNFEIKEPYLYDINSEIITAYRTIKSKVYVLIDELEDLEKQYLKLNDPGREKFYYKKRTEYNHFIEKKIANNVIKRTALLVFLNKTCFNGLFRVNSQGLYNVPFGRYENPTICDEENLIAVNQALKNAEIEYRDFAYCLKVADSDTFVYFDPPYRPISKTANFTSYIKNGFDDAEQKRLKETFVQLDQIGAKVMLSNSDPKDKFFDHLYRDYEIKRLTATRLINCDSSRRGLVKEVLI